MIFLAKDSSSKDSSSVFNFRRIAKSATLETIERLEQLESFNELKKYVKIYEKYNFSELETYSWWKNPFMFTNSKPEANDEYSQKEKEKATVMRTIFEKLGGQGSACGNTESISGNIVALKFYQRLSGCHVELRDFERAFCEVPEVDDDFIDTLNQFVKEFSAIMDDTDLAKHAKKMQYFINL
jgi:hypothetical protein